MDIEEEIAGFTIHECINQTAEAYDVEPLELASAMLFGVFNVAVPGKRGQRKRPMTFLPGHFRMEQELGPRHTGEVMIIGKYPQFEEHSSGRLMVGAFGEFLFNNLERIGCQIENPYLTNIVRFFPGSRQRVYRSWLDICGWFLHHEIKFVQPKYILLLGREACNFIFGQKASVSKFRGDTFEVEFPYGVTSSVVVTTLQALENPQHVPGFLTDLEVFKAAVTGVEKEEPSTEGYRFLDNAEDLSALVDELIERGYKSFALDAEWGGGDFPKGKLRSIQFCWAPGEAAFVYLRDTELKEVFNPSIDTAVEQLRRLFMRDDVRIFGQNLRGDLKWFRRLGLELLPKFDFDCMLADQVLDENRGHSLTEIAVRMTPFGRYDRDLRRFIDENNIKTSQEGYQRVPLDILFPYACRDADACFRARIKLEEELERQPKVKRLFYDITMKLQPILAEMENRGMLVDTQRLRYLTDKYQAATRAAKAELQELGEALGVENFNPNSYDKVSRLLFDVLKLEPVKTTDGKHWKEEYSQLSGDERESKGIRPSTEADVLALLKDQHPIVEKLRQYRVLSTVTSRLFKPYEIDETGRIQQVSGGLLSYVDEDGRIHTSFAQLTETGRLSSRDPNLQNLPSRQEQNLRKAVGDPNLPSIRSCFIAPEGYVIVGADYEQAELMTAAVLSGDDELYRVLTDPERDIHAEQAVRMFNLDWTPDQGNPKAWLKQRGLSHLRDFAKAFDFGTNYQGGAFTIWLQMIEAGADCTVDDCKQWMETYLSAYQKYTQFRERLAEQVETVGYIETPFGRRRRFYPANSPSALAALQREAVNFPIQSVVGDAISTACIQLYEARERYGYPFYFILQLHDALYFEVPIDFIEEMVESILPKYMRVEVPGYGNFLEIDASVYLRWDVPPSYEELRQHGLSDRVAKKFSKTEQE